MKRGQDFIIFPLDVSTPDEARRWADRLSGYVGMFKIGLELFLRTGPAMVTWIREQTGSEIFLDLKLHDIPHTVGAAARAVADLKVALTTVHCGESSAMLAAAVQGCGSAVGVLGVTVLTSVSVADLSSAGYREEIVSDINELVLFKAQLAHAAGCAGVVCSGHEVAGLRARFGPDFLAVTPGIRPSWQATHDDQHRVVTPLRAVADGADYLVIGRPIRQAADPLEVVRRISAEIDEYLASKPNTGV
jgi:orotidine-5'-phosphate decarboxylase